MPEKARAFIPKPPDPIEVQIFFENMKMPHTAKMARYLVTPAGSRHVQIGSGSADWYITKVPSENICLGIPGKEAPLETLRKIMQYADFIDPQELTRFNEHCEKLLDKIEPTVPAVNIPYFDRRNHKRR